MLTDRSFGKLTEKLGAFQIIFPKSVPPLPQEILGDTWQAN
jgi:hypothetical protein